MKLAICIQCRDASNRLKHKSVRPFYKGKSILEIIIWKLRDIYGLRNIWVLTTENSPKTIEICKKNNVNYFIGDEDNVFKRFSDFCRIHEPEGLIRICADNPFLALGLLYPIRSNARRKYFDYITFQNAMNRHEGFFCEYISEAAIARMRTKDLTDDEKQHVTLYIRNHPEDFRILDFPIPYPMDKIPIRLTVDTKSDFKIAQKVYRHVREKYWRNIYTYLTNNSYLLREMKKNIEMNQK